MRDLGNLVLALACQTRVTASTQAESAAFLAQHYSAELNNMVASLITKPPSVFEVTSRLGLRERVQVLQIPGRKNMAWPRGRVS